MEIGQGHFYPKIYIKKKYICIYMADAIENYCLKCKKKQKIDDVKNTKSKNGRNMLKGKCSVCGTTVCKFVK